MPAIRFDVDTSGARSYAQALRDELTRLGEQGKLIEREVKELGARLRSMEGGRKKAFVATKAWPRPWAP